MDPRVPLLTTLLLLAACALVSHAKPISLWERCWCRTSISNVPMRSIRELRFLQTPNCPFQVIAKLKSNKEVCISTETKWLQQYLKNALNKVKNAKKEQQAN
ncbi:chemokine (C-X-C motif) ligand 12a (stromal cell-derived factor 1) isoform X1 [Paramormyrops kingsleyae]|uniref:chemokine (C-X-C motif) ligand 12a (stromal cell-derived factor 1) isoform X1 n=2 Tax=Paramormyrops kingsleyae TaxID=1676925 RepID=UPI000CD67437|nr:stromal cell-derived factor 1-like isoform X1 [Paramormyrops kingsleyae]